MSIQRRDLFFWPLIIIFSIIIPVAISLKLHLALPLSDGWDDNITDYLAFLNHKSTWHTWFAFHNEHRLVLTRLVYALNYSLFPKLSAFPCLFSVLLLAVTLFLLRQLCISCCEKLQLPKPSTLFWLLLTLMWYNMPSSSYFTWPFIIQFPFLLLCSVASIYYANKNHNTWPATLICCALSILTTLSAANGLIIWIILFCQLLFLQTQAKKLFLYAAVGIITISLYMHGSQPQHLTLNQPIQSLLYLAGFLGNTTHYHHGTVIPLIAGGIILALYIHCLWTIFTKTNALQKITLSPWLSLMSITLFNAIIGSLTRVHFGRNQAMSYRYAIVSAIGLISLSVCYYLLKKQLSKRYYKTLITLMWLYVALILSSYAHLATSLITSNYKYIPSEIALSYGVYLPAASDLYFPGNQYISDRIFPFYQSKINPLAKPEPDYLFKKINPDTVHTIGITFNKKAINLQIGKLPTPIKNPLQLGQTVTGSIQAQSIKQRSQLSGSILFLNEDNRVIGVAFTGIPLFKPSNPALKLFGFQLAGEHISKTIWLFKNNAIKQDVTPLPN